MAKIENIRHSLSVQGKPGSSVEPTEPAEITQINHMVKINGLALVAKLTLLAVFLCITNSNVLPRTSLLMHAGRFETLAPYLGILCVSALAVMVASLQPKRWIRLSWAVVLALSSAIAWGYAAASKSELSVFEFLSLWNARHEADRAAAFYTNALIAAGVVFAIGFLIMAMPVAAIRGKLSKLLTRLAWLPLLPVAMIAAIVFMKSGGGSQGMPTQFAPIAMGSLAGFKIVTQGIQQRHQVGWQPQAGAHRSNIVILMDESVGADFIDLTPGNPHTPLFASYASKFVNFGRASSAGNCSNYSNALIRFGAARTNIIETVNTNPTIWQYAKAAGYRTVYIDAQAGNISNPGLMQNIMDLREKADIDSFHAIRGVASYEADGMLADLIAKELQSGKPTFIYANKNGAHFPYDDSYPAKEARYLPTMTSAGQDTDETRAASYRNAIAWSVDKFMDKLMHVAKFDDTTLLYTSDHAQTFNRNTLTHCIVEDPDVAMGVVPLVVMTDDQSRKSALEQGAVALRGHASHFQIVPTVLDWMGYASSDIAKGYDESLYSGTQHVSAFTSGDVFGLFTDKVFWWPVDLNRTYLTPAAKALLPRTMVSGENP